MNRTSLQRLYDLASAVLLALVAGDWLRTLWVAFRNPLSFDDAYMFARYAANIRHGLGMSWNLDGSHTYGPTSPLWALFVLVFSFVPTDSWHQLVLGSWLCSIGAVVALAWAVCSNATSPLFATILRTLPWIVLPLSTTPIFTGNQVNGMETMLATFFVTLFLGLTLLWHRGLMRPEAPAAAAILLFATRPESAVLSFLFPVLLAFLLPTPAASRRSLVRLLAVFVAGLALELILCKLYFHTPVPLSVYMKGKHAYQGYAAVWPPEMLTLAFFGGVEIYVLALIFLARRQDLRLLISFLVPPILLFAYFATVTQLMGFNSRYYAPYLACFVIPALLLVDRWVAEPERLANTAWPAPSLRLRSAAAAFLVLLLIAFSSQGVYAKMLHAEHRKHMEYVPATLDIAASTPLPSQPWSTAMVQITDNLIAPLPAGVTVAATEVGYLGLRASHANVIDIAGLNDTDIALHGFDLPTLLARKPDLIWMPQSDYTYQRGLMFADPAFLQQYDLYAGAANYGIALRKNSPYRAAIDRQMPLYWATAYPGTTMADYLVHAAHWTGKQITVTLR